jgi:hypothetical protein
MTEMETETVTDAATAAAAALLHEARSFQVLSMREQIRRVVRGEQAEFRCEFGLALCEIDGFLVGAEINGKQTSNETNGWDWDIWRRYAIGEKTFLLHHYGWANRTNFSLFRDDDDDDDSDDDSDDDNSDDGDGSAKAKAKAKANDNASDCVDKATLLPGVAAVAFADWNPRVASSARFAAIQAAEAGAAAKNAAAPSKRRRQQ